MHQDDEVQDENSPTSPMSDDDNDDVDLESLSKHDHPCLARGRFSVFNSLDVTHVSRNRDRTK